MRRRRRHAVRLLVAAILGGLVQTCGMTPALAAEPSPCLQATHLLAGAVTPCSGDLLPVAEVLRLLLIEDARDLLQAQIEAERAERVNDATLAVERWTSEHTARLACEGEHSAPCVCPGPRWYESWTFGAVVGVVGTIVVVGVVYAVQGG